MKFTFFFFFIFLGIFSQFWPSISEFTSFQSIFQSGNFLFFFLLDIFISARKYRIAPSTDESIFILGYRTLEFDFFFR